MTPEESIATRLHDGWRAGRLLDCWYKNEGGMLLSEPMTDAERRVLADAEQKGDE